MIEQLHNEGMSIIYTTHYMEEAERLCDRIAIIDHGRIIALGATAELVHNAFSSRSEVVARFENANQDVAAWVEQRGGRYEDGTASSPLSMLPKLLPLLDAAAKEGYELVDVSLRKPNLESVFLQLTGRELRD